MESGGEMNKMWPTEISQSLRGMVATDDIAEGEVLALFPYKAPTVLTFEDIESKCRIVK